MEYSFQILVGPLMCCYGGTVPILGMHRLWPGGGNSHVIPDHPDCPGIAALQSFSLTTTTAAARLMHRCFAVDERQVLRLQ